MPFVSSRLQSSKVDLDPNALYPHVEYPVSRGTPSLAPLVTWDHKDTWFLEFAKVMEMVRVKYFSKMILLNVTDSIKKSSNRHKNVCVLVKNHNKTETASWKPSCLFNYVLNSF